jgi:thiaminase/transcriptional activator TenA
MNAILNELPLHVGYCASGGWTKRDGRPSEAPETVNYTRYVLDIGHSGDALDLLVALMPCVAGYAEIGLGLLHIRPPDSPITPMPHGSATTAMKAICTASRGAGAAGTRLAAARREARITELSEIFTTATRLEASSGRWA